MCARFSSRFCFLAAALVCVLVRPAQAQVLDWPAKPGEWVEFEGPKRLFDGTTQLQRARFSAVGTEKVDDKPAVWVEVEWTAPEQPDPLNYPFRMKLLVPTKLGDSENPRRVKCRTYVQYPEEPAIRPAKPVSEEVIDDLRGRYCGCVPPKQVMTLAGEEEILVGEKEIKTKAKMYRHVQEDEEGTKVEYRYWLAQDFPFGVAKFAYKLTRTDGSGGEVEMTLRKQGTDAQPQWTVPAQ